MIIYLSRLKLKKIQKKSTKPENIETNTVSIMAHHLYHTSTVIEKILFRDN